MKKAIFSVLIGTYDTPRRAPLYIGWDALLFTDQDIDPALGWKVINVPSTDIPHKESRKYKWLSHRYLPEYELVCYIDMNMELLIAPPLMPFWFRHPKRSTVSQEVKAIVEQQKDDPNILQKQIQNYQMDGFSDTVGLFQNGFFCRYHRPTINQLHEEVWSIIQQYSHRDQLALPFAVWKLGIAPDNIRPCRAKFYHIHRHHAPYIAPKPMSAIAVHHITPGRGDKNFGKAINEIIKGLPDEDWICLRDIDTIPPAHEQFFSACEEIAFGNKLDLIGCMTGRIGMKNQLLNGEFSENTDFMTERRKAQDLYAKFGSKVLQINETIAGMFMLFSKKTWEKVGGFPEGAIQIEGRFIDYHFSKAVKDAGLKIGIAKGIYLFHTYRLGAPDVRKAITHLL